MNGNPIGPLRIWDHTEQGPGLMMSRSFGDQVGHRVGMTASPGSFLSDTQKSRFSKKIRLIRY